ncbi:hypothetical protein HDU76_000629 [Blyttiomyces sp. JEL0837]|nr:hypothetical protein HDU76_000629 [Blyttiomyces sp. JEL0837]
MSSKVSAMIKAVVGLLRRPTFTITTIITWLVLWRWYTRRKLLKSLDKDFPLMMAPSIVLGHIPYFAAKMRQDTGAFAMKDLESRIQSFVLKHPEAKGFRIYLGDPIFSQLQNIQLHLTDISLVQELLKASMDSFTVKSLTYNIAKPLIGNGILASSGPTWKKHRLIVESGFNIEHLRAMAPGIVYCVDEMIDRWLQGSESFDCRLEYLRLTLRVFTSEAIGFDSDKEFIDKLSAPLYQIFQYITNDLAAKSNTGFGSDKHFNKHMIELNNVIRSVVQSARVGDQSKLGPVMKALLRERKGEESLTDDQIMDEIKTLLFAGHDTTGNSLAWGTYVLATNDEVREKLLNEIEAHLPNGRAPTSADVDRMVYLNYFVKELLRLYPPAIFERTTTKPINLNLPHLNVQILKGILITFSPKNLSTVSKYVENPHQFFPDRWSEDSDLKMDKRIYFPFSLGTRNCVGMKMALMEMKLAFVRVLQRCKIEYVEEKAPAVFCTLTVEPEHVFVKVSSKS